MRKSKVYISFPKVGLGNMLLIWARAFVFAKENNLELSVSKWWGIRPGRLFSSDTKKRLYWNYFTEDSISKKALFLYYKATYRTIKVKETFPVVGEDKVLYIFNTLVTNGDLFKDLKKWRDLIRKEIFQILHPALKTKLETLNHPVIGVHIRRGDFIKGSTITPLNYFIQIILKLREASGKNLPVTVFSDATDNELDELFCMANVTRAEEKEDILDILLLSKSEFLILSVSSTFSFWAAFLSDGVVIKNPIEWHPHIRPSEVNKNIFEGKVGIDESLSPLLLKNFEK